jgi:hypothetical protein
MWEMLEPRLFLISTSAATSPFAEAFFLIKTRIDSE